MNAAEAFGRIVSELEGRHRSDTEYRCRCPCPDHEDLNPSCDIKLSGDKILVKCRSRGCPQEAIIDALKDRGLWPTSDPHFKVKPHRSKPQQRTPQKKRPPGIPQERIIKDKKTGEILDTKFFTDFWTYKDEHGKVLGYAVRFENEKGKDIVPYFNKNQQDNWYGGSPKGPRPLYGLNLIHQAPKDLTIWIVEGEKCAEALRSLPPGVRRLAITSLGGTNAAKFTDWFPLAGRKVRIWPDHDEPGKIYAEEIKLQLEGLMPPPTIEMVDVVKLGLEKKGDAYDWLQIHKPEELDRIPLIWEDGCSDTDEVVEGTGIGFISFMDLASVKIEDHPIIDGFLGEKESLIICADSGAGKSLLASYMALHLGYPPGKGLWGLLQIPKAVKVLMVQSENSYLSFNKRLRKLFNAHPEMALGAENVFTAMQDNNCRITGNLISKDFQEFLIDSILAIGVKVLMLDPLISYHKEDENENADMRASLDCLSQICEKTEISTVICHHYNRAGQIRGASAIRDWADNLLLMDIEERREGSVFLKMTHDKCRNYEQQPTFFLERTPDLQFLRCGISKKYENVETAEKVLREMGGTAFSQAALKNAIMTELNCQEYTARKTIETALGMKRILIIPGKKEGGRGTPVTYVLP